MFIVLSSVVIRSWRYEEVECISAKTDMQCSSMGYAADRGHSLETDRGVRMAPNAMPREQSQKQNKTYNHVYNLKTQADKTCTLFKNTV